MPARILIVDDDPSILEALGAALVPPHTALTAHTGLDALDLAGQQAPDLVLLDYLLPDVSGPTAYRIAGDGYYCPRSAQRHWAGLGQRCRPASLVGPDSQSHRSDNLQPLAPRVRRCLYSS